MEPLIIGVALNGNSAFRRNPAVPMTPDAIAQDAIACIAAGATLIHNHIEDYTANGAEAAARFEQGWRPIVAQYPDIIFSPTASAGATIEQRWAHNALLAERGLSSMAWLDPGSCNMAPHSGADGMPGRGGHVYQNSFDDIDYAVRKMAEYGLGPDIAIFEPGFLRAILAYARNGLLPPGALIRFYFGGDHNPSSGVAGGLAWGLPPTATALAAYREMMEGVDLPWMVAVAGGDVAACGIARLAIEQGGHVRVGLEDYAGPDVPDNATLVAQVAALAKAAGRPIADPATARAILDLPPKR